MARTWGIYLIPRDKAPDEGWLLTHGTHGGLEPVNEGGKGRSRWRAWWLPLTGRSPVTGEEGVVPEGKPYRANKDINELVKELVEDHVI